MDESPTGARVALAAEGAANVSSGVPVLDHLVGELARAGRFRLSLEVAPGSADEAVAAAGRALGARVRATARDARSAGRGWALVPGRRGTRPAALERVAEPRLVTNVDFSDQRVGGLGDRRRVAVPARARARRRAQPARTAASRAPTRSTCSTAIFKAVGAALGQACRPAPDTEGGVVMKEDRSHRGRTGAVPGRAVLAGDQGERLRVRLRPAVAAPGREGALPGGTSGPRPSRCSRTCARSSRRRARRSTSS